MDAQAQKPVLKKDDVPLPPPAAKTPSSLISAVTVASPSASSPEALPAKQQATHPTTLISKLASTTTGGIVLVSSQQSSSLPKPPPLIPASTVLQVANTTATGVTITSVPGIALEGKPSQKLEPVTPQTPGSVGTKDTPTASGASSTPKSSGGGLGAGKPKSFLALMASGTKKPKKTSPGGAVKASKGQANRKASPSSSALVKKLDQAPSRTSNRSIKRPRTYDDEWDDAKAAKPSPIKKIKGTPKVVKSVGKKTTLHASAGVKDLGRWRPTDDLMLISAVQQTNDLTAVHLGVNFSCRFTLQEVEERWHALLYSPQISQLAIEAMKALHPGVVTMALNNALWSQEEEAVLARIPTTDPGHLEKFQSVLKENPAVFHTCRTATSLHHHWVLMGHNGLLNNQKVDLVPPEENIKEFADAEDRLEDNELMKTRDVREEALEQELAVSDRQAKTEILKLEEEIPLWRTVIDTGSPPDFGSSDYAVLKGKVVEFRMTKRAVTLGRSTGISEVDFDLSLEGPAFKISRRQASIQLTDSGEFMLHNEGRRPVFVGGRAIASKASTKLAHNQVIEVASMSFLILVNTKLANLVKNSNSSHSNSAQK